MRAEPVQRILSQAVPLAASEPATPIQSRAQAESRSQAAGNPLKGSDLAPCMDALRRRATRLTGNLADADDLVQETLKRALIYLHGRADIANPQAYLFTMLHHAHYDLLRQRPGRDSVSLEDAILVTPPVQIDRLECREMMVALDELPREQRQVLQLVGLEGHTYKDTAATLEIPIGTVMSRLSRGRERLSHLMGRGGNNDNHPSGFV